MHPAATMGFAGFCSGLWRPKTTQSEAPPQRATLRSLTFPEAASPSHLGASPLVVGPGACRSTFRFLNLRGFSSEKAAVLFAVASAQGPQGFLGLSFIQRLSPRIVCPLAKSEDVVCAHSMRLRSEELGPSDLQADPVARTAFQQWSCDCCRDCRDNVHLSMGTPRAEAVGPVAAEAAAGCLWSFALPSR